MELAVIVSLGVVAGICGLVAIIRMDNGEEWRREWNKRRGSSD